MDKKPTIVEMMNEALGRIREMVTVDTVVGETITTPDGTTIIPVSRVSFGFGTGGSDWGGKDAKNNFGGGAGAGVSVTPVCFMIVSPSGVRLITVEPDDKSTLEKALDMAPMVIDKIEEMLDKYANK